MKIYRLLAALLFVFSVSIVATAQEGSELASLRAKAERGNGIAQYNLGLAYAEGRGTAADPLEAFVWLSLARENGARGRALDNLVASFDRATLEAARQRLVARKDGSNSLINKPQVAPAPHVEAAAPRAEAPLPVPPAATPSFSPEENSAPVASGEDATFVRLRGERDSLSTKLTDLAAELAALRAEREQLAALAAENARAAQAAHATNGALQEQNRAAEARAAGLARESETMKAELERTKQALAALEQAPKPAPDTAALDQKTRELQAVQTELEASRNFGREVEATLNKVTDQKSALEAQLAALTRTRDETQTAAAQETAALKAQLAGLADEAGKARQEANALEQARAAAGQQLAELGSLKSALEQNRSRLAASEQQAATLNARVVELEQQAVRLADGRAAGEAAQKRATEVTAELAALQAEVVRLRQKPDAPKYPDLSGRVHELEAQVAAASSGLAAASTEADRTRQELAVAVQAKEEALRQLGAKPTAPAYPDLSGKVTELEARLAAAEKPAAPSYPDLSGRVGELEAQLAGLRNSSDKAADVLKSQLQAAQGDVQLLGQKLQQAEVALNQAQESYNALQAEADKLRQRPAAPAYPDLSDRVRELETQVAAGSSALASARAEADGARQQITALTQAKEAAEKLATEKPAYPDLSGRVQELEAALAAKPAAPAYPDLSGRVHELEVQAVSASAALASARADAGNAKEEVTALIKAKEDSQARISTLIAERDAARTAQNELGGALVQLEQEKTRLAAARDSAAGSARQIAELGEKVAAAEQQAAALRQERDALSGKMTDLVGSLSTLQADRERMQKMLADAGRQMRDATAAANRIKELETQMKSHAAESEAARTAQAGLQDAVTRLEQEKTGLTAALQAARNAAPAYPDLSGQVTELETRLAAAEKAAAEKPAAPAYPDLSGRVSELEAALAAAGAEHSALQSELTQLREKAAQPAYPDLSGRVQELEGTIATLTQKLDETGQARANLAKQFDDYKSSTLAIQRESTRQQAEIKMLESDKAALRRQVDTVTADAAQWRTQVSTLKAQTAAVPTYPDLSGQVTELENRLAAAEKAAAEKPAAPPYPDLSGRVNELETALAAAGAAQTELQRKLDGTATALQKAVKDQNNDENTQLRRERDELAGRVTMLAGEVAQLRSDRERMQKMLADAGKQMRDATADASRIKELETRTASLQGALDATQAQVGSLRAELAAKPAAPSYPDLSGRVRELEAQVSSGLSALAEAKTEAANAKQELAAKTEAASRNTAPAYPDLSGRVSELEAALAAAEKATVEKPAAPPYPDLSGRVNELETALADTKGLLAAEQARSASTAAAVPGVDVAGLQKQLAETEEKLEISLRGYATLEKERDTLAANAGQAAGTATAQRDAFAAQVAALTGEITQLKSAATTQAEAANQAAALAADKNNLATRLADVEARVAAAQAEADRANQALAALQRTTAQGAGELAATRTLVRQLQGSNTVLASENYQLKTMLARSAGTPAPVTAAPVAAPSAGRTHLVASGDSLSRISQRYYGTAGRWQEIYNANRDRISSEGVLRVGTELRIP